jgi:lysozyme family protein
VLTWENWRTDDPNDPGGLTIWGICKRDWPGIVASLAAMTKEDSREAAKAFYLANYWNQCGLDDVETPLDVVLFDAAINQGTGWALRVMEAAADWRDAIILRSDRYDDLKLYDRYGRGWNKRLVALRDYITSGYTVLEWDRPGLYPAPHVIPPVPGQ